MSYVSSVASDQLVKTPQRTFENWPTIFLFAASEALFSSLGETSNTRMNGLADFWDPTTLRTTLWGSLMQGIHDTVNANIWGYGFQSAPSTPTEEGVSGVTSLGAYY